MHRISLNMATWTAVVEEEVPEEISLSTVMMMKALTRALTRAISLSMALKMKALTRTIAEEEVPKKAVLNMTEKVERLYRRQLISLDLGRSLNCPPTTSCTAGALQAAVREPGICR